MRPNWSGPGTTGAADRMQLVSSGADGPPGPLFALDGKSLGPRSPGGNAQDRDETGGCRLADFTQDRRLRLLSVWCLIWRTRSLLMLTHSGEVERRMDGLSEHPPEVPTPNSKALYVYRPYLGRFKSVPPDNLFGDGERD